MPLDKTVKVRLKGDISDFNQAMLAGSAGAKAFANSLDSSTDRMGNLVQMSLALGPALVPISAAAVPAISGLTNQLAFAAAAAGVAALAFQGVGDALKTVNQYQLEPTAANFEKMRESLATLGPDGRGFVVFLQELRPELQKLQNAAQKGLFPGVEVGLTRVMNLLPQAERIVSQVSSSMGMLIAEAGDNLDSPKWHEFFDFLETEARPTLLAMGRTLGNFVEGFANLWMAFQPLSSHFSDSFLKLSRDFAKWTDGLDKTEGFQEFLDYIERVGPKAWDTLGALGEALLQIVEAAAPVGEVSLPVITAVAKVLGTIADSPAGPALIGAAAGISAISRAMMLFQTAQGSKALGLLGNLGSVKSIRSGIPAMSEFGTVLYRVGQSASSASAETLAARASVAKLRPAMAAGIGVASAFALSMTDVDEKMGLSNTAMFASMGLVAGPWGAAIGGGIGLAMDFAASNDDVSTAIDRANAAMHDSRQTIPQLNAMYDAAAKKVADFKKSIEADGFFDTPDNFLGRIKNDYKGLFGGRSDVEENDAALKALGLTRDEAIAKAQEQKFAEAGMSAAMRSASKATRDSTEMLLDNVDAINAQRDALLEGRNKQVAYEQAIDDATAAAKKNGHTLDINTQAGRDNRTALDHLASAWNDLDPAAQNAKGAFERARREFVNTAIQMGATRAEAKRLADKLLDIPTHVATKVDINTNNAIDKIAKLQKRIDSLHGKTIGIHVQTPGGKIGGGTTTADAAGSIHLGDGRRYMAFAAGTENHVAQIGTGDYSRVWNEPETKGEAYIPLANDWRRPRAKSILTETARLIGMQAFAGGGITGGGSSGDSLRPSIVNQFTIYQQPGESSDELAERLFFKQRARA